DVDPSDGIVALTGGPWRIGDAVELLAAGYGRRLLITGVHPDIRVRQIARLIPAHRRLFDCCVDPDYSALNTVGNAIETRRWVEARGFRKLIVVTSRIHMPRAMAELSSRLPDTVLVPFPVAPDRADTMWWYQRSTIRLLITEYLKYIVTV